MFSHLLTSRTQYQDARQIAVQQHLQTALLLRRELDLLKGLTANVLPNFLYGSLYRHDDCIRSQVVDHMPEAWKCDQLALRQFPMQALRLTANIRNLIVGTCDDRCWHPPLSVVLLQLHR